MSLSNAVPNIVLIAGEDAKKYIDTPDALTQRALDDYNYDEEGYERSLERLKLKSFAQDIGARQSYARNIFVLIVFWLCGIGLLLILQGFGSIHGLFHLSDSVLLAIVGGTTLNILGLFVIVVNYLFEKRNGKSKKTSDEKE